MHPHAEHDHLPAFPLSPENIKTLLGAKAFREALLNKIASAKYRIYLTSLYIQNDEAGQTVMEALYTASRANPALDICVAVDWHRAQRGLIGSAQQKANAAWYQEISARHGARIPVWGVPVQTKEIFGVLHLKGFIIDDEIIYSGASINNVYLYQDERYRIDRYHIITDAALSDCMVRFIQNHLISSPAVYRLDLPNLPATRTIRKEIRAFRYYLTKANYGDAKLTHPAGTSDRELCITPLSGLGKNSLLNRQIITLLTNAQKHVIICTPYFNLPKLIARTLQQLLRRQVRVDIIVGDKTASDFYLPPDGPFKPIGALPYLYEINLHRFVTRHRKALQSGLLAIHVWKHEENSYHAKGIWVDDCYTLLTGSNLNPRAFRLDLENALLMYDPNHVLQTQRTEELAYILQHTQRIYDTSQIDRLTNYPAPVRRILSRLSSVRIDRLLNRIL